MHQVPEAQTPQQPFWGGGGDGRAGGEEQEVVFQSKRLQLLLVCSSIAIHKYPQVIEGEKLNQTHLPVGRAMVVAAPKRTAVTMRALEEGALTIVDR